MKLIYVLSLFLPLVLAQQYTTPVPILKQINKHNEDGSYSYGYEGADGTYKIETKYPNGEVYGKYGYIDDQGTLREVEYGATRRGFEPAGQDINAAPPTLTNNQQALKPLAPNEEDDGQYREDPSVYYKNEAFNSENNINNNAYNNRPSYQSYQSQNYQQPTYTNTQSQNYQQPSYQQPSYQQPSYQKPTYQQPTYQQPTYQQPSYQQPTYQQPTYQQPSYQQPSYQQPTYQQPSYQQPSYQQPSYQQPAFRPQTNYNFNSQPPVSQPHPLTGVDYASGSYSVSY